MGDLNADLDLHKIHNFTQRITNGDELNMFYSYTFLSSKILQINTKLIHLGQYKQHRNEPKLLNGDLNARFWHIRDSNSGKWITNWVDPIEMKAREELPIESGRAWISAYRRGQEEASSLRSRETIARSLRTPWMIMIQISPEPQAQG